MSGGTPADTSQGQRRHWVGFTDEDIDELLEDLPGGQSIKPVTRRLHRELRDARRRVPQGDQVETDQDDLLHAPAQPVRPAPARLPRRGYIVRKQDVTGISGVGVIGELMQASDGAVAYRWLGGPPQNQPKWEFYDNKTTAPFEQISGHTGKTEIVWIDDEQQA